MDRVFSLADAAQSKAVASASRSDADASRLPCLSCHISTETVAKVNKLNGSHKKTAHALVGEIQSLAAEFGLNHLGLLTFTFADHVTDIREAQRRFNSLNTHVIRHRYSRAVAVWERQRSGRIHFHLVVVTKADIRTGADFAQFAQRVYRSASPSLRAEWSFWRLTAPRYGFGRTELLPVKSTAEGISLYVGKYISKHVGQRLAADSGAKTVRYIGFSPGQRKFNSHFSWQDPTWRLKLAAFASSLGYSTSFELRSKFGRHWRFILNEQIAATEPASGGALMTESQSFREYVARMKTEVFGYQAMTLHQRKSEFPASSRRDFFIQKLPRPLPSPVFSPAASQQKPDEAERANTGSGGSIIEGNPAAGGRQNLLPKSP